MQVTKLKVKEQKVEKENNITDKDVAATKNTQAKDNGFLRKIDTQLDMIYIIEWLYKGYVKDPSISIFYMRCPFCGSVNCYMKIDTQKKTFWCSVCGIKGGIVLFVMLFKKISLRDALQLIADKYGIDVSVIPRHVLIRQV